MNAKCKRAYGQGIQRCNSNCQIDVAENKKKGSASKPTLGLTALLYCFAPVQLPAHPSDRWKVPDPPRPEKRPDMVQLRLPADPIPDTEPFGLT